MLDLLRRDIRDTNLRGDLPQGDFGEVFRSRELQQLLLNGVHQLKHNTNSHDKPVKLDKPTVQREMTSPVTLKPDHVTASGRAGSSDLELQVVVVFRGGDMYCHGEDPENLEHSERSDRDGAASGMSLSMRPRMASARQDREAARLSEMQESAMGRAEDRPQICPFDTSPIEV